MEAGVYVIKNNVNGKKEASEKTGIKYNTIQKRLKNNKFTNYCYIDKN